MDDKLSLSNLREGAAIEQFDHCLQQVLDNIQDPNTDAEGVREINLKVKFKPDKERALGEVTVQASSKLAPVKALLSRVFLGMDYRGKGMAREAQIPLFQNEQIPEIAVLGKKKEEI